MPRRDSVKSLRNLCLKNVAQHFESVWFSPFEKIFGSSSRLIHVLGPFDHITSDLNRDLIHVLIDEKLLKLKHFQLLLNNRLTELDFREARFIANQESVIDTIAVRCQRLMKLNLDNYNRISPKSLINLVSNLTSLRHLSLHFTKCNDAVMQQIGACCPDLVELDVTGCTNITDKGFHLLFKSIKFLRKLKLLKVLLTKMSPITAGKIVNLRKYLDIQYGRTCEMIEEVYSTSQYFDSSVGSYRVPMSDQLSLCLLSNEEQHNELTINQIELTCAYCPNIREVILHGQISNESVQNLRYLTNLRKLEFACSLPDQEEKLSFEEGITPILQEIGHHILDLKLHEIDNVCLATIGSCCMNLQKLKCTLTSVSPSLLPVKVERKVFTKLTYLWLHFVSTMGMIPSDILKTILLNAKMIKSIFLSNIQSLTTDLLLEVINQNKFISLCELELEQCNNIDQEAIFELLSQENDLAKCSLLDCNNITLADFENFQRFVKKNKLNLEIYWR